MSGSDAPTAAVFDFDGTLTVRDTSLAFLRWVRAREGASGRWGEVVPAALALLADLPRALPGAAPGAPDTVYGRWERLAHERMARAALAGLDAARVRGHAEAFARERLPGFLRPGALERLRWHRDAGHVCVLVSASLGVYLKPWGERAGLDHVIGNELAVDAEGRVSGAFEGAHCWGAEKVRRVEALLGPLDRWVLHVYGDSAGDRQLLARAREAVRVVRGTDLTPPPPLG